jgi:cysteinyl-tRNA synthetase
MTIRFFILQAHYRSTLDFSNEALQGSEKGLLRLMKALKLIDTLKPGKDSSMDVDDLADRCENAMMDDMNTPGLIAHLFDGVKWINGIAEGKLSILPADLLKLKALYHTYIYDVLGLTLPTSSVSLAGKIEGKSTLTGDLTVKESTITEGLVEMILQLRTDAKANRDFDTADRIRDSLSTLGITIKDRKDGADWEIN